MKFSKEQFKELEDGGIFCCDDIAMHWVDIDIRLNVFNSLPQETQGTAVAWGVSDTPFRDDVFVYLVKELYDLSVDEYYENFNLLFTDEYKNKNSSKFSEK